MDFQSLGLADIILSTLATEGYITPTPIQARSIPEVLAGKDVLGIAQTGTGKTAAFAIPIIQRLMTIPAPADGPKRARALILSPTRELATQIAQSFRTYGEGSGITGTTIYGGVGQGGQVKALQRGVDVIVATPGRLLDLMSQGYVDLRGVQVFVLDEADRMLDMGFIKPIRDIIAQIPKARQSLLFSATMPGEIQGLADSMLRNPVRIEVAPPRATATNVTQALAYVPRAQKVGTLIKLLDAPELARVIVFTKTKHGADKVAKKLYDSGIDSEAIHGNRNQNQRQRALNAFKTGRVRVLVATDVAARGLDVDDITHVINIDLPMEPEAYVHRIGRTGRAGASGIAISFCDATERPLLRDIERMLGKKIPLVQLGADQNTEPMDHHAFDGDLANHIPVSPGWHQDGPRQEGSRQNGPRQEGRARTQGGESRGRQSGPSQGYSQGPSQGQYQGHSHNQQHRGSRGNQQASGGSRFQPRGASEFIPLPPMGEPKGRDGGARENLTGETQRGQHTSRNQHFAGAGPEGGHASQPKRDPGHSGHKQPHAASGQKPAAKYPAKSGGKATDGAAGHKSGKPGAKPGGKSGAKPGSKSGFGSPSKGRFGPPRSR